MAQRLRECCLLGRCLHEFAIGSVTSNKPLEWTGHHLVSATPPYALCLPLRGSVRARPNNPVNSFGIRIAQPLFDGKGLSDEVEIVSSPGLLTITPSVHLGAGWVEAAAACDAHGLLDEITATRVDDDDCAW